MSGQHSSTRAPSADDAPVGVRRAEDLLVRNHDFQWGYDLEIEVRDEAGEVVLEGRYYLQPGATESELDVLPPGTYDVRVVVDNRREAAAACRIGEGPREGILVELGNGAVSVHDGLYA